MSFLDRQNYAAIPLVIMLLANGQSGVAGTTAKFRTTHGVSINTSADGGAAGSWVNLLAEMIATRRGHTVLVSNAAYGGTSVKQYAGYCDGQWLSGRSLYAGVTTTNLGYVYSLYGGDNTKISASYTTGAGGAPVGTVTGVSEDTADTLKWKCLGPATARDVQGTIYNNTDVAGKFDPLGRMAATTFAAMLAHAGLVNRYIVLTEWGEQDAPDVTMTRTNFATAITAVIEGYFARAAGVDIFAAPGLAPYYGAQDANYPKLTNAILDVLANYSAAGDGRVFPGANLRTELGVLPTNAGTAIKSLKSDAIHLNEFTVWMAAEAQYAKLLASGKI